MSCLRKKQKRLSFVSFRKKRDKIIGLQVKTLQLKFYGFTQRFIHFDFRKVKPLMNTLNQNTHTQAHRSSSSQLTFLCHLRVLKYLFSLFAVIEMQIMVQINFSLALKYIQMDD